MSRANAVSRGTGARSQELELPNECAARANKSVAKGFQLPGAASLGPLALN